MCEVILVAPHCITFKLLNITLDIPQNYVSHSVQYSGWTVALFVFEQTTRVFDPGKYEFVNTYFGNGFLWWVILHPNSPVTYLKNISFCQLFVSVWTEYQMLIGVIISIAQQPLNHNMWQNKCVYVFTSLFGHVFFDFVFIHVKQCMYWDGSHKFGKSILIT